METLSEKLTIDRILDEIMEVHGLSRGDARRWLREFIDHSKRHRFTQGMPELMVNDGDVYARGSRRKVVLANERRIFIDEDGNTCIPHAEQADSPEIHVPDGESLFHRTLKSRSTENKPHRGKFTTAKRKKSTKPLGGATEPVGMRSRVIYFMLKRCAWNHGQAKDKLMAQGFFDHYSEKTRNSSSMAAVLNVKKRYGPDS